MKPSKPSRDKLELKNSNKGDTYIERDREKEEKGVFALSVWIKGKRADTLYIEEEIENCFLVNVP